MNKSTKIVLFWAAISVLIVIAFFGRDVFFRGKIIVNSQPPYQIQVLGGENFTCSENPCVIRQTSGIKDLYLQKEGHQSVLETIDVGVWSKSEIEVIFKPFPKLMSVDVLPEIDGNPDYSLVMDEVNGMQKLVSGDSEVAIVYFPKAIDEPVIFGDKNYVLIVDKKGTAYKVDVRANKRDRVLVGEAKLLGGKWSLDGRYFVFSVEGNDFLWLMDSRNQTLKQLDINSGLEQIGWVEGRLVFVSDQPYNSSIGNEISEKLLKFLSTEETGKFIFAFYYPALNIYGELGVFPEITQAPKNLIPTTNGSEVYFESGEGIYKIATYLF